MTRQYRDTHANPVHREAAERANWGDRFSDRVREASGSLGAFLGALIVVAIWAATGPLFHFSDTWQLVINTSTTIVTFEMVFIIQHSQNRSEDRDHALAEWQYEILLAMHQLLRQNNEWTEAVHTHLLAAGDAPGQKGDQS